MANFQLTRNSWAVVGVLFAYIIVSFLAWQSVDFGPVSASRSMWHGFGVLAGLLAFALAILMGVRASGLQLGPALPLQLPTLALSALMLLCTFIRFIDGNEYRTGIAWVGLLLAIVVFVVAYLDAAALLRMFRQMRAGRIPGAPSAFAQPAPAAPSAPTTAPTETPNRSATQTMSGIDGQWQCKIDTPLGEQNVLLTLSTAGGTLSGRAETAFGSQDFDGGTINGNDLAWQVSVTQPMPLELKFTATVEGDAINGTAIAGPLGEQPFSGTRVAA
jgi:hypothetical protein